MEVSGQFHAQAALSLNIQILVLTTKEAWEGNRIRLDAVGKRKYP
jgi:hypothetical protein